MNRKTILRPLFGLALLAFLLTSCIEDQVTITSVHYSAEEYQVLQQALDLPPDRHDYRVVLAEHMRRQGNTIAPAINNAKATLGRVLFYDKKLSRTEETSCASCHDQTIAFSDHKALSDGIDGQVTKRNSLPLASTANFSSSYENPGPTFFGGANVGFFWDERASSIAQQSTFTIQDDIEMGMDMNDLAAKLAQERYYQILFGKAYGEESVTPERITDALQEFVNSFVSVDSKFDKGMDMAFATSVEFPNYTEAENRGKSLYMNNCTSCHSADMTTPTGINVANNGLDLVYEDKGMGDRTQIEIHNGVFKVPFLRNVALTGPYMHDGRFETLEEVVEHYSTGIQDHDNLAPQLKNQSGSPMQFNFTTEEKQALVAFLETLTDESFIADVRYSDPFK